MPIYINMVRDPIEKAISWYYYIRSAPYLANVRKKIDPNGPSPDKRWLEKVKTNKIFFPFYQFNRKLIT